MPRGHLITIEGLDGAGKSTLARSLLARLTQDGLAVELLREPGGVQVSERIRSLLLEPGLPLAPRAEALLYAAARAQLVEQRIDPLLSGGTTLLLDRFVDSSLAYQGAGRGLGIEQIADVSRFAVGGLRADLTLLLDIPAELGRRRKAAGGAVPDRLELEDEAFFERIADAYRQLARAEPQRIQTIDATVGIAEVLDWALQAVSRLLAATPGGD